jgi:hypothetical protein
MYGSYGGLFVFTLLDDYRVCVKKRNFYRPPSDATSGDAWRWEPAYVLAEAFSLVDTIFTSTAGKGPDRRRCRLVCRIRYRCSLRRRRKKIRRTCYRLLGVPHTIYSDATNIGEEPLPKHQTSRGVFALFEKIYDGELILTVISNIGEDVQYRCFHCVSLPDTVPLLVNNY